MKRSVAVLVALMMVAATGCSAGTSSSSAASSGAAASSSASSASSEASSAVEEDSLFNAPGELPIVKEPTTLTIFAPGNGEYSWVDNDQTKLVEEKTGIHLEWSIAASSDNVRDKISTMFASGTMTDIILSGVGASNRYDKASEAMFGRVHRYHFRWLQGCAGRAGWHA